MDIRAMAQCAARTDWQRGQVQASNEYDARQAATGIYNLTGQAAIDAAEAYCKAYDNAILLEQAKRGARMMLAAIA